jgi:hypothetical protein
VLLVRADRAFAADHRQALGRELLGAHEVAIGGADGARREAVQPGGVHQLGRQLLPLVGDAAALVAGEQLHIALGRRRAVQRAHDLEDLARIFLVVQQLAQRAQGVDEIHLPRPAGGFDNAGGIGHGHGSEFPERLRLQK